MKNDPRLIRAKFDSVCHETGKKISKGDECVYYPIHRQVFHRDSKTAQDFRSWMFDQQWLGGNY